MGAMEILLKHGASPDLESKFGKSPLDIASDNGRPDLYEILLVIKRTPYVLCDSYQLKFFTFSRREIPVVSAVKFFANLNSSILNFVMMNYHFV